MILADNYLHISKSQIQSQNNNHKTKQNLVLLIGMPNVVFSSMCFGNFGSLNLFSLGNVVAFRFSDNDN